jgi:hypothetical protein
MSQFGLRDYFWRSNIGPVSLARVFGSQQTHFSVFCNTGIARLMATDHPITSNKRVCIALVVNLLTCLLTKILQFFLGL